MSIGILNMLTRFDEIDFDDFAAEMQLLVFTLASLALYAQVILEITWAP